MQIIFPLIKPTNQPKNYAVVDNWLSRSAQPTKENIVWLKKQGITDVFNFRTMCVSDIDFDEKAEVELMGMKYHSIPSVTRHPSEENIDRFLKEMEEVKIRGGKAHMHCKAGADRTGMYAFIYKMKNGIDTLSKNQAEWFEHGYHYQIYPKLMEWTRDFVARFRKK